MICLETALKTYIPSIGILNRLKNKRKNTIFKENKQSKMKKITYLFIAISIVFVSCTKEEGCTDPVAANYNSDAENDDGSGVFDIVGVWSATSVDFSITQTSTLAGQTIFSYDTSYTLTPQDADWDFEDNIEFTSSGTIITPDASDNETYTTSGNTLTIVSSDGEESESTFTVSKTNLSITMLDSETETDLVGVTNSFSSEMTINCTRQ